MLLQKGKASTSISISFLATNISKYSVMGNYLMVETLKDANSHSSHHHLAGDQINTIVSLSHDKLYQAHCLLSLWQNNLTINGHVLGKSVFSSHKSAHVLANCI